MAVRNVEVRTLPTDQLSGEPQARLTPGARRILEVASELFYRHGIHAVGVDTIAAESGITKRTLYDRFGSKDALVAAYLQHHHDAWWTDLERRLTEARAPRILTVFDAYAAGPLAPNRGCAFLNAAAELPVDHPGYAVIRAHKQAVRSRLAVLVRDDHPALRDPAGTADTLFLLLEGAIANTGISGDDHLLQQARAAAARLIGTTPQRGAEPPPTGERR